MNNPGKDKVTLEQNSLRIAKYIFFISTEKNRVTCIVNVFLFIKEKEQNEIENNNYDFTFYEI